MKKKKKNIVVSRKNSFGPIIQRTALTIPTFNPTYKSVKESVYKQLPTKEKQHIIKPVFIPRVNIVN
jgi:hypothetical protein